MFVYACVFLYLKSSDKVCLRYLYPSAFVGYKKLKNVGLILLPLNCWK
jgi:hypothetical protein